MKDRATKLICDMKLGGVDNILERGTSIQRNFDTLKEWNNRNFINLNKDK